MLLLIGLNGDSHAHALRHFKLRTDSTVQFEFNFQVSRICHAWDVTYFSLNFNIVKEKKGILLINFILYSSDKKNK